MQFIKNTIETAIKSAGSNSSSVSYKYFCAAVGIAIKWLERNAPHPCNSKQPLYP